MGKKTATFKFGFEDNVLWNWNVSYSGNLGPGDMSTLTFYGDYEYVNPSLDPVNIWFMNELPNTVWAKQTMLYDKEYLEVDVNEDNGGPYKMEIHEQHNDRYGNVDYILYHREENIEWRGYLPCPPDSSYWLIIYETKKNSNGEVTHDYIGDKLYLGKSVPWDWSAQTAAKKQKFMTHIEDKTSSLE